MVRDACQGRCRDCRRQECLARRDGADARTRRHRDPAGVCDDRRRLLAVHRRQHIRATIAALLADWDAGRATLAETGDAIRSQILRGTWPEDLAGQITRAYAALCKRAGKDNVAVAVRSSATAEDLPDASFAGQQETFLNIRGESDLMIACRRCYASLFTDRAISYRKTKGFDHMKVALSIGVQEMVRSDLGGSGVMFSIDTETGFDKVVLINAAWGLGENVVQGTVDPDEYMVFKPLLADPALRADRRESARARRRIKMIYATRRASDPQRADDARPSARPSCSATTRS